MPSAPHRPQQVRRTQKEPEHPLKTSAADLTRTIPPPDNAFNPPGFSLKEAFVVWLAAGVLGGMLGVSFSALLLDALTTSPPVEQVEEEPPARDPPLTRSFSRGFDLCQTDNGGLITCIPADHPMLRIDFPHHFNDTTLLSPRGLIGPCFGM